MAGRGMRQWRTDAIPLLSCFVFVSWACWTLFGEQDQGPDYMFGPIRPPGWVQVCAALVALGCGAVFIRWAMATSALAPGYRRAAVACVFAGGIVLGIGGRVVTAGVSGANIGGALIMVLGAPTVAIFVGAAMWRVKPSGG